MKNICILIFISALVACSDKSSDKTQLNLTNGPDALPIEHEHQHTPASEVLTVSKTEENTDKMVTTKESDQATQISCLNQNITEWHGFGEAATEPRCETVKSFKLTSYKCDISKNAFGADKDAILLETQAQRIFIYSSSKDCNEILEIRNSNAP